MNPGQCSSRKGVATVLAAALIFGMLFTAGFAYITWQAQAGQNENIANLDRQNAVEQGNLERISLATIVSGSGPYTVTIMAENSGGIATTLVGAYASSGGALLTTPGIVTEDSVLTIGDSVSLTLPAISVASGMASVLTSRGNTFSAPFPNPPTQVTATISTTYSSTATTMTLPGLAGSNALVVQMVATPPVSFGCDNGCVTDNVTVYNFAPNQMSSVALLNSQPSVAECGNAPGCTASLTPNSACAGPYSRQGVLDSSDSLAAYSGSGNAPSVFYLCTYNVVTGNVGGYASFSGQATAQENFGGSPPSYVNVVSAEAISNTIQLGGSTNVLGQGPFTVNFFVFKYSSCTNGPSSSGGHYTYSSACSTTPATMPPNVFRQLGNASLVSAGSNYYVALYFQVTNDYTSILPILKYSFVQFESAKSLGEADMYIVGGPSNSSSVYPNYCKGGGSPACTNDIPTFNAYTATASSCAETKGEPPASTCINVSPGQSAVLTFAACGPGSPSWEWGGSQYAKSWDPGYSGCATVNLNMGTSGAPTALILVLSYLLNNVVYTEDIAFQSMSLIP
jgi:hypothetical protein